MSKENREIQVGIIFGAGTHITQLENTLRLCGYPIIMVKYHPTFTVTYINENGKTINEVKSRWIDFISKLYGFIKFRFYREGKGKQWLLRLYKLYDRKCVSYLKNCTHLIAWPLVSEKTMEAVKSNGGTVLLEYPMIHPLVWQTLVGNEYRKNKITNGELLFTQAEVTRLTNEISLADKINVLSSVAKKSFVENGVSPEKISVLTPIIEKDVRLKNQNNYNPSQPIFLYAGRLDANKGAQYLLRAFTLLQIPNAQLYLAGRVTNEFLPLKKEFDKLTNVHFLNHVSPSELDELYQKTHFLVLPSVQESFGMVVPEAMMHGVTTLVSSCSGAGDLVVSGSNGYIFESGNLQSLTECLKMAVNKGPFDKVAVQNSIFTYCRQHSYVEGWKKLLVKE